MNCIHNSSGGSLRELLSRNVGQYAAASFLVGSCRLVRQEGVLEEVGTDYLVLRQGDALRLEYAVKQLARREKLALLQRPDTAAELVSGGAVFEPVPGVTLDMCLEGTFHG